MIGIQILAILFALWMMYFSYLHFRRKEFSLGEVLLWQVLWIGLVIVVIFPGSVSFLLRSFSISRTFDFVVIVGMVILYAVTFRNLVLLKRVDRRLEDLVRSNAIDNAIRKQVDDNKVPRVN